MIKKVAGTVITRVLMALLTFLVVILNTRFLGAEKVGLISLIVLAISIIQIVNNFVGGASLVYFVSRAPILQLFLPSYLWAAIVSVVVAFVLYFTGTIPEGFLVHVLLISLIQALGNVNIMILLGQERISAFNTINLLQLVLTALILLFEFSIFGNREIQAYITALYAGAVLFFVWSFVLIYPKLRATSLSGSMRLLREILKYGFFAQSGNLIQLFNYRLSYLYIRSFLGTAPLGIYSVGAQVSEGLWIVSRSMSLVQFSRISNEEDRSYAARLTLLFIKLSVVITSVFVAIILLLPSSFFTFVFGPEFGHMRGVIASLTAGIVLFSASIVISPYFSGTGRPHINTIGSAIGLVFTVLLGLILIPAYGITGAGITASVSYGITTIWQVGSFLRKERFGLRDLLIRKSEIDMAIRKIRDCL